MSQWSKYDGEILPNASSKVKGLTKAIARDVKKIDENMKTVSATACPLEHAATCPRS